MVFSLNRECGRLRHSHRAETIYESYNEFQAVLRPDGSLRWEPGGIFKTMCQIDITYYPFDEQKCDLTFGAWSYYTSKMNMTTNKVVLMFTLWRCVTARHSRTRMSPVKL